MTINFCKMKIQNNNDLLVVLFDGDCNYCNSTVNFFIRNDNKRNLKFITQQSVTGKKILSNFNIKATGDSIIFIENNKQSMYSGAIFHICKYLNWPLNYLYYLVLIPGFIRDGVYKLVARNRFKLLQKNPSCILPSPDVKERFLD